jgi:hypothetical protein
MDRSDLENALKDGFEIHHTATCHGEHGFIVYTLKKEKTNAK